MEVTHRKDGGYILSDYNHLYDDLLKVDKRQRFAWILIGKVIFKGIVGAGGLCSAIQYLAGHDVCRIAFRYLRTKKPGTYAVRGRYIQRKKPGCEPMYSYVCNTGYWEYKVR